MYIHIVRESPQRIYSLNRRSMDKRKYYYPHLTDQGLRHRTIQGPIMQILIRALSHTEIIGTTYMSKVTPMGKHLQGWALSDLPNFTQWSLAELRTYPRSLLSQSSTLTCHTLQERREDGLVVKALEMYILI